MDFLPVFLNIKNRHCLVVGGGDVAARKISLLRRAGGLITVIAPQLGPTLSELVEKKKIVHLATTFSTELAPTYALAIAATDDQQVNEQVAAWAELQHIPVNVVDQPQLCTFIMPSIIDRSPVIVAVSSGGASPVLARLLRARLETLIPASFGRLAMLLEKFRQQAKQRFADMTSRRRFWERVLQGPIAEMVFSGRETAAVTALTALLQHPDTTQLPAGEVYLVGAGPGDPDLLTFRALRLLQQADVIVYDRLVAPAILDLARREAERIYVGKQRADHTLPQEGINELLVRLAKSGKRVLRLKGGDPFIFGRGGEEIETLAEEGVPFQIVPGITAASGCASYAGIPLTHRDYAQSVIFVTGHLKDGTVNLNWPALVQPQQTVAVYMGLVGIETLCREMIAHGKDAGTPVALIQQGTTSEQKVFIGTLATLPNIVEAENVKAPTLIIIGDVVQLHEKLTWFDAKLQSFADNTFGHKLTK